MRSALTIEQLSRLRRFAADELPASPRGRRWLELLLLHRREILRRLAVDRRLRHRVEEALAQAAPLVADRRPDAKRIVEDGAASALASALDQLGSRASAELRPLVRRLRADVDRMRGRAIDDVLREPVGRDL